jgi:D-glycero-D-manno-heptose 1,7-bisphosphate phosphatase
LRDEETGAIESAFHPSHLRLMPGVVPALERLVAAGLPLAIASNQPGAAKGRYSVAAIERTNAALVAMLASHGIPIAVVESCTHHPDGDAKTNALIGPCDCRKPKPGMLLTIAEKLSLDRASSWMVGDTRADVEAAHAAGMKAALLADPRRPELCPLEHAPDAAKPDFTGSMRAVVDVILSQRS